MLKEKNKPATAIEQTYKSIKTILEKARSKSFNAVNTAMVQAYWHIGRVIIVSFLPDSPRTAWRIDMDTLQTVIEMEFKLNKDKQ